MTKRVIHHNDSKTMSRFSVKESQKCVSSEVGTRRQIKLLIPSDVQFSAAPKPANPIYMPKSLHNTAKLCLLGFFPPKENHYLLQSHHCDITTSFCLAA